MSAFSNAAEDMIIAWLMTDASAPTRPTAWYVSLHTGDPGETGASNELSGNGYSRQAVTFADASSGASSNEGALTFGPNTSSNWGTVSHIAIWSASTSGTCYMKGALAASRAIAVGDSLVIAIGDLDISVD